MSDNQSFTNPTLKVVFNQGSTIPSNDKKAGKRKDGLRKGKWTAEEEKFANKIIEVFNAGLLKLQEEEKGITLRAYLAAKLDCDPMRITKKYTGASCLGKKVYHFDPKSIHAQEADLARRELELLERQFKAKLEQMNRKKSNEHSNTLESSRMVSTPAIDALVQSAKPVTPSQSATPVTAPQVPAHGSNNNNLPRLPIAPNAAPLPYYGNGFNPQMPHHPYYPPYGNMPYYQAPHHPYYPSDNSTGVQSNNNNYHPPAPSADAQYPGMNDFLRFQQMLHQGYTFMGMPNHHPNQGYGHFIPPLPYTVNAADLISSHSAKEPNDAQRSSPTPSADSKLEAPEDSSLLRRRSIDELSLNEDLVSGDEIMVKKQKFDDGTSMHAPTSSGKSNNNTATSSLIGIINQLQKISSQENLLDFFDPSKSITSSLSSNNLDQLSSAPPTQKLTSRESVENLVKLLSPRIVMGQL